MTMLVAIVLEMTGNVDKEIMSGMALLPKGKRI